MKTTIFSLVATLSLVATTASYAAAPAPAPFKDHKEMGRTERERAAERARQEAQRRAEQKRAAERARWEAQHRHDDRRRH